MDVFYPFIHQEKKKVFEPEPLYIELGPPPPSERQPEKEEEKRIVIIELF